MSAPVPVTPLESGSSRGDTAAVNEPAGPQVHELIGVYHADGGVLGELRYAVGRITGRTHCALCDVTHAGVRRRPQWDQLVAGLGVPFRLVHLNERDEQVALVSRSATPCVLGRSGSDLVMVLTPAELAAAGGSVDFFAAALGTGIRAAGLSL